jgi:hypothetical protein
MFQFPHLPLLSQKRRSPAHHGGGLPHSEISGSACKRLPGAYRSVTTSFIGPVCLGIHHLLFLACANSQLTPSVHNSLRRRSEGSSTEHLKHISFVAQMWSLITLLIGESFVRNCFQFTCLLLVACYSLGKVLTPEGACQP